MSLAYRCVAVYPLSGTTCRPFTHHTLFREAINFSGLLLSRVARRKEAIIHWLEPWKDPSESPECRLIANSKESNSSTCTLLRETPFITQLSSSLHDIYDICPPPTESGKAMPPSPCSDITDHLHSSSGIVHHKQQPSLYIPTHTVCLPLFLRRGWFKGNQSVDLKLTYDLSKWTNPFGSKNHLTAPVPWYPSPLPLYLLPLPLIFVLCLLSSPLPLIFVLCLLSSPLPLIFPLCLLSLPPASYLPLCLLSSPLPPIFALCLLSSPLPLIFPLCLLSSPSASYLPPLPLIFPLCLISLPSASYLPPLPLIFPSASYLCPLPLIFPSASYLPPLPLIFLLFLFLFPLCVSRDVCMCVCHVCMYMCHGVYTSTCVHILYIHTQSYTIHNTLRPHVCWSVAFLSAPIQSPQVFRFHQQASVDLHLLSSSHPTPHPSRS